MLPEHGQVMQETTISLFCSPKPHFEPGLVLGLSSPAPQKHPGSHAFPAVMLQTVTHGNPCKRPDFPRWLLAGFGELFPEGCVCHSQVLPSSRATHRSVPRGLLRVFLPVPQQGLFSLSTGERGRQAFEKMDRICCELRETAQEAEIEITVF